MYPNASLDGGLAIAIPQDLKVGHYQYLFRIYHVHLDSGFTRM